MSDDELRKLWSQSILREIRDPSWTFKPRRAPTRAQGRDGPFDHRAETLELPALDANEARARSEDASTIATPRPGRPAGASPGSEDGYVLGEEIGRGGMGIVYKASQSSLRREVAIKRIDPRKLSPELAIEFAAEAMVTGRLEHPNIVPVHEFRLSPGGEMLLAMKLVGGHSWKALIAPRTAAEKARAARLDRRDHIEILMKVCDAVAFAHSKGIAHCDLKPDNVMVGEFNEVLVMDWGVAVDFGEPGEEADSWVQRRSEIDSPRGTPVYMAPELAEGRGEAIGPWTDVYLLGACLHHALTGAPPHSGDTPVDILVSAVRSRPATYAAAAEVSRPLAAILHDAMRADHGERIQTATELRARLEVFLERERALELIVSGQEKVLEMAAAITSAGSQQAANSGAGSPSASRSGERDRAIEDAFAGAAFDFKTALLIWEGAPAAAEGLADAKRYYLRYALHIQDLKLARRLAEDLGARERREVEDLADSLATRSHDSAAFARPLGALLVTVGLLALPAGLGARWLARAENLPWRGLAYSGLWLAYSVVLVAAGLFFAGRYPLPKNRAARQILTCWAAVLLGSLLTTLGALRAENFAAVVAGGLMIPGVGLGAMSIYARRAMSLASALLILGGAAAYLVPEAAHEIQIAVFPTTITGLGVAILGYARDRREPFAFEPMELDDGAE